MQVIRRASLVLVLAGGCATPNLDPPLLPPPAPLTARPASTAAPTATSPVRQAAHNEPAPAPAPTGVEEFVRLAVERNPRLARAALAVEAARGRHQQAGLYPNPDVAVNWDELGDRSSPDNLGILTAPRVTQQIVTGGKLTLAQAVAAREVDQAVLEVLSERYAVAAAVRAAFYEALTLQQRAEILAELVKLADEAVAGGQTLLDAKRIARLDIVQLETERERYRADLAAVRRELPAAYRRLAAAAGTPTVIPDALGGTLADPPAYDADAATAAVLASHPDIRSAKVGVERARAAVKRAEVEPIPNVTVYAAYIRQFENRSHDGAVGLSAPIPVWNKNQGNIRAAKAELGMAIQAVGRAENDLAGRVAAAMQTYSAARARAEAYRTELLPRAEETYTLARTAFQGGQFEYLRVIQAQRAIAEARLELNKALGDGWRAAAELSGLLLEDEWPNPPPPPPPPAAPRGPGAGPVMVPPAPPRPDGAKGR
jgi:cobalt-zinc-cadmium efflux system outer membrane protein